MSKCEKNVVECSVLTLHPPTNKPHRMNTKSRWRPLQGFRDTMEYKVFNVFFCKTYGLPLSVFDFASYMREVLDKHVTDMIEVEVSSWVLLCVALCFNVIRHEFKYAGVEIEEEDCAPRRSLGADASGEDGCQRRSMAEIVSDAFFNPKQRSLASTLEITDCPVYNNTEHSHTHEHSWVNESHTHIDGFHERILGGVPAVEETCCVMADGVTHVPSGCEDPGETGLFLFMICGWCLLLFVVFLSFLARRCELRLLDTIGCSGADEYAKYIQVR